MKIDRPTWLDPRIEIRPSQLEGLGSFAAEPITVDDTVTVWAHSVIDQRDAVGVSGGELHLRDDGRYLWLPDSWVDAEGYDEAEERLNHSCDPSVWMRDEVTLIARRDIAAGEELTLDYALIELDEDWSSPWRCRCGTPLCRGGFTGRDWQDPALQERYAGHWHPTIEARIARSREAKT